MFATLTDRTTYCQIIDMPSQNVVRATSFGLARLQEKLHFSTVPNPAPRPTRKIYMYTSPLLEYGRTLSRAGRR